MLGNQHPHVRHFSALKDRLDTQLEQEKTRKPIWRPQSSLFQQLVKDIRHYVSSVASPQTVLALHDRLRDFHGGRAESGMVISQAELWLAAQRGFYQSLKSKYIDYPDIVVPLLAGIAQMIHGAELLVRNVKSAAWRKDFGEDNVDWSDSIADLFDRPSRLAAQQPAGILPWRSSAHHPEWADSLTLCLRVRWRRIKTSHRRAPEATRAGKREPL